MINRLCIYAKDISMITGKGLRCSQKILRNIRYLHNKQAHQYVTVKEFADYAGIELELILPMCR